MSQVDQAAQDASAKKLISKDISDEVFRSYSWICPVSKERECYTIHDPISVHFYKGCTTHRVVDKAGFAHCVPAVGFYHCVLSWKSKDEAKPVAW